MCADLFDMQALLYLDKIRHDMVAHKNDIS